jgi:2-haloacid dehalogenase
MILGYDLVLLDLDDTIFDYTETEKYALEALFKKYMIGYRDEYRTIYSEINSGLWRLYEKGGIKADELRTERFVKLLKRIGHKGKEPDLDMFSEDYLLFLSEKVFFEPFAQQICIYLKNRYKVVFLTNGIHETQKRRLFKAGLLENEADLVSSEIADAAKPDPAIISYALDTAGIENKEKVIMIGDSMVTDIKAAVVSGIASIWYNRKGRSEIHGFKADHEICSLLEIRSIL